MKIVFSVSQWRKGSTNNKFNSELSDYWQKVYEDSFKNWREVKPCQKD